MQERLEPGADVEITGLVPQLEVGEERRTGGRMPSEPRVVFGVEHEPTNCEHREENGGQRRKNATDAARVEIREAEAVAAKRVENDSGNQVAGDRKEHVDADEAARQDRRK